VFHVLLASNIIDQHSWGIDVLQRVVSEVGVQIPPPQPELGRGLWDLDVSENFQSTLSSAIWGESADRSRRDPWPMELATGARRHFSG
jgi:hypothetical protein